MQKKTVRWIATVTLAGAGVLTSAAAASAAATPYDPSRVQASPATCAALNNDVANALDDLTMKLSPNNTDAAGAMSSAANLAKLIGVSQTLGCPAIAGVANPAVYNQLPNVNNQQPNIYNQQPNANAANPAAQYQAPAANTLTPELGAPAS